MTGVMAEFRPITVPDPEVAVLLDAAAHVLRRSSWRGERFLRALAAGEQLIDAVMDTAEAYRVRDAMETAVPPGDPLPEGLAVLIAQWDQLTGWDAARAARFDTDNGLPYRARRVPVLPAAGPASEDDGPASEDDGPLRRPRGAGPVTPGAAGPGEPAPSPGQIGGR